MSFEALIARQVAIRKYVSTLEKALSAFSQAKTIETWKITITNLKNTLDQINQHLSGELQTNVAKTIQNIDLFLKGSATYNKAEFAKISKLCLSIINSNIFPAEVYQALQSLDKRIASASSTSPVASSSTTTSISQSTLLVKLISSIDTSLRALKQFDSYADFWYQLINVLENYRLFFDLSCKHFFVAAVDDENVKIVDVKAQIDQLQTTISYVCDEMIADCIARVKPEFLKLRIDLSAILPSDIRVMSIYTSYGSGDDLPLPLIFTTLSSNLALLKSHPKQAQEIYQALTTASYNGLFPLERRACYFITLLSFTNNIAEAKPLIAAFGTTWLQRCETSEEQNTLIRMLALAVESLQAAAIDFTGDANISAYLREVQGYAKSVIALPQVSALITESDNSVLNNLPERANKLLEALALTADESLLDTIYEKYGALLEQARHAETVRVLLQRLITNTYGRVDITREKNLALQLHWLTRAQLFAYDTRTNKEERVEYLLLVLETARAQEEHEQAAILNNALETYQTLISETEAEYSPELVKKLQAFSTELTSLSVSSLYNAYLQSKIHAVVKSFSDNIPSKLTEALAKIASLKKQMNAMSAQHALELSSTTTNAQPSIEAETLLSLNALAENAGIQRSEAELRDLEEVVSKCITFIQHIMKGSVIDILSQSELIQEVISALKTSQKDKYREYADVLESAFKQAKQLFEDAKREVDDEADSEDFREEAQGQTAKPSVNTSMATGPVPPPPPPPPPLPQNLMAMLQQAEGTVSSATNNDQASASTNSRHAMFEEMKARRLARKLAGKTIDSAAIDQQVAKIASSKTSDKKPQRNPELDAVVRAKKKERKGGTGTSSSSNISVAPQKLPLSEEIIVAVKSPVPITSSSSLSPFLATLWQQLVQVEGEILADIAKLDKIASDLTSKTNELADIKKQNPFPVKEPDEKGKAFEIRKRAYLESVQAQEKPVNEAIAALRTQQDALNKSMKALISMSLSRLNAGCDIHFVQDIQDLAQSSLQRPAYVLTANKFYFVEGNGHSPEELALLDTYIKPPVFIPFGKKPTEAELASMEAPISAADRTKAGASFRKALAAGGTGTRGLMDTEISNIIAKATGHNYQNALMSPQDSELSNLIARITTAKDPNVSLQRLQKVKAWLANQHFIDILVLIDKYFQSTEHIITEVDTEGYNILQLAISANAFEMVEYLLFRSDIQAAVKALTAEGLSVLHLAALLPPTDDLQPNKIYALLASNPPQGLNPDAKTTAEITIHGQTFAKGTTAKQIRAILYPTEAPVITRSTLRRSHSTVSSSRQPSSSLSDVTAPAGQSMSAVDKVKAALTSLQADAPDTDENYQVVVEFIAKQFNLGVILDKATDETLLHRLVMIGHSLLVEHLLGQKNKMARVINAKTKSGQTALDIANTANTGDAQEQYVKIVSLLIDSGAKPAADLVSMVPTSASLPGVRKFPTMPRQVSLGNASSSASHSTDVTPPSFPTLRKAPSTATPASSSVSMQIPTDFANNALLKADKAAITAGLKAHPEYVTLKDPMGRSAVQIVLTGLNNGDADYDDVKAAMPVILETARNKKVGLDVKVTEHAVLQNPAYTQLKTIIDDYQKTFSTSDTNGVSLSTPVTGTIFGSSQPSPAPVADDSQHVMPEKSTTSGLTG